MDIGAVLGLIADLMIVKGRFPPIRGSSKRIMMTKIKDLWQPRKMIFDNLIEPLRICRLL